MRVFAYFLLSACPLIAVAQTAHTDCRVSSSGTMMSCDTTATPSPGQSFVSGFRDGWQAVEQGRSLAQQRRLQGEQQHNLVLQQSVYEEQLRQLEEQRNQAESARIRAEAVVETEFERQQNQERNREYAAQEELEAEARRPQRLEEEKAQMALTEQKVAEKLKELSRDLTDHERNMLSAGLLDPDSLK